MTEKPLSRYQEKFARLVATEKMSLTEAYLQAYPASQKWLRKTVWEKASELAAEAKVAARIANLTQAAADIAAFQAADVLLELRRVALSDISAVMHDDGRVKLPHELDINTRRAIKKFRIDELGRIEYEFYDKNAALDKAMKHLGLYEKDNGQKDGGLAALFALLTGSVVRPRPGAALPDPDVIDMEDDDA